MTFSFKMNSDPICSVYDLKVSRNPHTKILGNSGSVQPYQRARGFQNHLSSIFDTGNKGGNNMCFGFTPNYFTPSICSNSRPLFTINGGNGFSRGGFNYTTPAIFSQQGPLYNLFGGGFGPFGGGCGCSHGGFGQGFINGFMGGMFGGMVGGYF